jgi:putative transposase
MKARRRVHRRNYNEPGHAHELTFSCYHGLQFLKAERTCHGLIDAIDEARGKWDVDIWAFVFMPEHVHLIVHPRQAKYDIADIRQAIKEPVGRKAIDYLSTRAPQWLRRVTRRRGKKVERLFWQSGGGYDRNIEEPETLAAMIEYIHLNPVRRGLVELAIDWPWSSAAYYEIGRESPLCLDPIPPEWLHK